MEFSPKSVIAGLVLPLAVLTMAEAQAQQSSWWGKHRDSSAPAESAPEAVPQSQSVPQQQLSYGQGSERATVTSPGYTYVEGGAARLDVDMYGIDESVNGGYVRGSVAVTDGLYVFGGYDRVTDSGSDGARRAEVTIDQSEIGLGARIEVSRSTDFVSELSMLRLGGRVDYEDATLDVSLRDHVYAGKYVLGFRGKPSARTELWAKAGYVWVDDNLLVESSMVGNVGGQFQFTPVWGLVGEAEFYEDLTFFRLGIRAQF